MNSFYDAVVVGAGPAGLATARELAQRGIDYVVLERGSRIGHTWDNLYDTLVLHTGKHLSALPGMSYPSGTPLFPSRLDFLEYLHRYAEAFRLSVETGASVVRVLRGRDEWVLVTARGDEVRARAVVTATGIVADPHVVEFPGRERFCGRIVHSVEYRRPDPFKSQRVLVVGAGNSAGEIASELAAAGALVTIAVRSGARTVPRQLLGIPIQYFAVVLNALPRDAQRVITEVFARASELLRGPSLLPRPGERHCSEIPMIGFHLMDALRAGSIRLRGGVTEYTNIGARFVDGSEEPFDQVILATGYRAAVGILGNLIQLDDCGFASRRDRVISKDQPDLYFVGHNYDSRGGLRNIAQDARMVGKMIGERRIDGGVNSQPLRLRAHKSA